MGAFFVYDFISGFFLLITRFNPIIWLRSAFPTSHCIVLSSYTLFTLLLRKLFIIRRNLMNEVSL